MRSRQAAALLTVAALALSGSACGVKSSKKDDPAVSGAAAAAAEPLDPNTKVTISVGCQPPKTAKEFRADWDADVQAFQAKYPNITIDSKDAFPCIVPETFQAKLAGGQMEDVYYVYYTDAQSIIANKQAADITDYAAGVQNVKDVNPLFLQTLKDAEGRLYGLPRKAYTMGLVYNRKLFSAAGLNPDSPPNTWAEVRDAAKKISALGDGVVGYGEYSAANTGGWHFTSLLYGQGGSVTSADGKTAAFNSPEARTVLQNLKDMRWADDSMGTKQGHRWEDLMRLLGSGKLGMMVGAPDVVTEAFNNFGAKSDDLGTTSLPEAKSSLLGGDGYMINPKASPDQIKAAILWLSFHELTVGEGQFNHARNKASGRPVGIPENILWGDNASGTKEKELRQQYATVPPGNFAAYEQGSATIPPKTEPPQAQAVYAVLDTVMSAVLTREDADIDDLLAEAEKKVNAILARTK
ncbi:ABC-type glycerol-3-phosphate transport system substrate-binding protein [Actinocorallia herbida]|uniref:ABC-type glycerol-3-phosphate transport system substrate-binding protein n=1 Tax=Actinocorallia herbida TaxID=58109 RepID=A0A3N1CSH8_9ACTN|nr:extracellular solute-binding protein [Actinocorallia herbida]ROO84272.1 ABC-type glycerol-3-phosphate transport system substrate-binding protein [Actinocorallia herbida]